MSLFDDASLVLTPNGYKASKLYSIKPTSGLGDMTVVRATTARRVNSAGLIESVATNVPRLDYTGGSCPSILVEPARTNLALYSEEFDNIYWTKVTTNITANTAIAPDGTMTADTFTPTSAVLTSAIQRTFTGITGSHTISVYARVDTGTKSFRFFRFNATDGNVSSPTFTATTTWQRFTWNTSPTVTSSWFIANASTDLVPFFVWGAQLEAGSNATSYIPTVAATVTRNADVISKTGISSLIGQTEGTLFVDVNYKAESIAKGYLNLGTAANNYIAILTRTNNKIGMEVLNSGVQVNASSTLTYTTNQRLKIAMTYKLNDFKLYVNGILQATDTSGTVPAKAEVVLGSSPTGSSQAMDGINLASIFTTALTDTQLATLTTI